MPTQQAKHRSPWTDNDLHRLREFAESGSQIDVIAHHLGRTEAAIKSKARTEGITLRSPRPSQRSSSLMRWSPWINLIVGAGALAAGVGSCTVALKSNWLAETMLQIEDERERRAIMPITHIPFEYGSWQLELIDAGFLNKQQQAALISFSKLYNIGDGPALNVFMRLKIDYGKDWQFFEQRLESENGLLKSQIHASFGKTVTHIPAHTSADVNFVARFPWPEANFGPSTPAARIELQLFATDLEQRLYKSTFYIEAQHKAWLTHDYIIQLSGPQVGPVIRPGDQLKIPSEGPLYGLRTKGGTLPREFEGEIPRVVTLVEQIPEQD